MSKLLLIKIFFFFLILYAFGAKGQMKSEINTIQSFNFDQNQLLEDLKVFETALKEANPGLYAYIKPKDFDSLVNGLKEDIIDQKMKREEHLFYERLSNIVCYVGESHQNLYPSLLFKKYLSNGKYYLPLSVRFINKQIIIDSISGFDLKGMEITKINSIPVAEIMDRVLQTVVADGRIILSKYTDLQGIRFSKEFTYLHFGSNYSIEYKPQESSDVVDTIMVKGCSLEELISLEKEVVINESNPPFRSHFVDSCSVGILKIDSFDEDDFKNSNMNFIKELQKFFKIVFKKKLQNLIIDLSLNTGGTEGFEDKLFSYFIDRQYIKYDTVCMKNPDYSFFNHTDIKSDKEIRGFKKLVQKEFTWNESLQLNLRKPHIVVPSPPQSKTFQGQTFVIISGLTYSGASEFCTLMRTYTEAKFVGEETGGAYQGNTSGYFLELTLPHSQIEIRIPLVQFKMHLDGRYDPSRGIKPDFEIPETMENNEGSRLNYILNYMMDSK